MRIRELRKPKDGSEKMAESLSDKIGAEFRESKREDSKTKRPDANDVVSGRKTGGNYQGDTKPAKDSTPNSSVERQAASIGRKLKKERAREPSRITEKQAAGRQLETGAQCVRESTERLSETIGNDFENRRDRESHLKESAHAEGSEGRMVEVHIKWPEVRGQQIRAKKELMSILKDEYSRLSEKADFHQRLREAVAHLKLCEQYCGVSEIPVGEITRIARQTGVDRDTLSNWVTKGMRPRLYTYMEWAVPRSEAERTVQRIRESNNGVHSLKDVDRRLDIYYFGPNERNAHFHNRERFRTQRYFYFFEAYSKGGNTLDIAKKVGISDGMAYGYLHGEKPWLVNIAVQIPAESPPLGYKWLPKVVGRGIRREDWIQVPEKVTDYRQVLEVLSKLRPLDNPQMRRWDLKFGKDGSRAENLMRLMGAICSDSNVPISSTSSMGFGISLGKVYPWSRDFGDSCCYYLGQIGLYAHQISDGRPNVSHISTPSGVREIRGGPKHQWEGNSSPVLRWIRLSCLGYDDSPKTYQQVSADWILSAPRNLRIAFLQGISDGDASASYKGDYYSVSSHSNRGFLRILMESLGLETYTSKTYVRTSGIESLRKAALLPPFKHATERQIDLQKAVAMFDATRRHIRSNPLAAAEIEFMRKLANEGLSFGTIRERLYDRYGYTLDPRDIQRFTQGSLKRRRNP